MRLIAIILACMTVLGATLTAEARDKRPTYRKSDRGYSAPYRSSTIAPNGTCQRDTGRPLDSLNLNQECDREEFWNRMNDRGGGAMH